MNLHYDLETDSVDLFLGDGNDEDAESTDVQCCSNDKVALKAIGTCQFNLISFMKSAAVVTEGMHMLTYV